MQNSAAELRVRVVLQAISAAERLLPSPRWYHINGRIVEVRALGRMEVQDRCRQAPERTGKCMGASRPIIYTAGSKTDERRS